MCRSLPQMPALRTRSSTSPGPGSGVARSWVASPCSAVTLATNISTSASPCRARGSAAHELAHPVGDALVGDAVVLEQLSGRGDHQVLVRQGHAGEVDLEVVLQDRLTDRGG